MNRRRAIALTTWAVATGVAVSLAWFAVSYAVSDVADPIPKAIAHGTKDAPAQLVPSLDVTRSAAVDAVAPAGDGSGAEPAEAPTTTIASTPTPAAGTPLSPPPAAPDPAEGAPSAGSGDEATGAPAPAATTAAPAATTASFGSPGGTVTVRCSGSTISLVSATPQSGFRTQVDNPGPQQVEVHFVSSTREYEIHAICQNGQPTAGAVDD